ncbi:hypothetical protein EI94DRAFT_1827865 [Lactarius quietus]|nr:hypothetical protein EI94DRAFT_1827865 [Lactarius quietus]
MRPQRLRVLLCRKTSGCYGRTQNVEGVPFYKAVPTWWANFTWGLIVVELGVTCVNDFRLFSLSDAALEAPRRPAWQHAGFCLAPLALDMGFATLLLIARSALLIVGTYK